MELNRSSHLLIFDDGFRKWTLPKVCSYSSFESIGSPLDKLPLAVRALMGFLSAVDLPVAVERARIRQLLATDIAADHRLPIWAHHLLPQ